MTEKIKGFTLIELLVTMVILGIVAAMAFPLVRKISENNTERKYKTYANSLESSAKLYVDSYGDDLFGHRNGEVCVSYKELHNKLLTKDIADNNLSCNTDDTKVRIIKTGNVYSYVVQLGCGQKNGDKVNSSYIATYPKNGSIGSCDGSGTSDDSGDSGTSDDSSSRYTYNIDVDPQKITEAVQSHSVNITLTSPTGISSINNDNNNNHGIYYKWTKDSEDENNWTKIIFNNIKSNDKQKEMIAAGKSISASAKISTPSSTGSWTLHIYVESIQNASGEIISKKYQKNYFPYKIDKTPPTIKSIAIKSSKTEYSSKKVNVTLDVTDNNMLSNDNKLKVCIKDKNEECAAGEYVDYQANKTYSYTFSGDYDGSDKTLYVFAKDVAGNVSSANKTYTIYKTCSEKNKISESNEGGCSASCGGGKQIVKEIYGDKYIDNVSCGYTTREDVCNQQPCCSESNFEACPKYAACRHGWTNIRTDVASFGSGASPYYIRSHWNSCSQPVASWQSTIDTIYYINDVNNGEFARIGLRTNEQCTWSGYSKITLAYVRKRCIMPINEVSSANVDCKNTCNSTS